MTLIDTGPLVAFLDDDDPHHQRCVEAIRTLPRGPLLTTWPCLTEAMYLLGQGGGYRYQSRLWELLSSRRLLLHDLTGAALERMADEMRRYQDTPMNFADASLVAAAESLGLHRVFSLDHHFRIYRLRDGSVLAVVP